MGQPVIESLVPSAGIEGGEIIITCSGFVFSTYDQAHITIGGADTRPISASPTRIIAPIPGVSVVDGGAVEVTLEASSGISEGKTFIVGRRIAANLHPVATPADPVRNTRSEGPRVGLQSERRG